ncbi:Rid family hydrolase [Phocaeicola abscessus]|uniref:Rid family hydrolase n=1 Tax=Phocaeicola abscessus TaxID=555313 RepID=UPI0003866AF1|nr:Rid family hydrolase [Phocaeicola abscessus]EPT34725.1 endoribonuclease L-PSP [Bacteroidetes bacterium oral taxon 272 str. F0290]
MDKYEIIACRSRDSFAERMEEISARTISYLTEEQKHHRRLQYCKVFLSDIQNQYRQLIESKLYQEILSDAAPTIVEQVPLDGSKITLLLKTSDEVCPFVFQPFRLTEEEASCNNSYLETMILFEKYLKSQKDQDSPMDRNLVRTWIYVNDIDNNYNGVVKARNDVFKRYGLSVDTHFIASTGIGGNSCVRNAFVAMDFLTYPNIREEDKFYLKALDHLSPTHDYGVSFERGTRLSLPGKKIYYISGTASIDKYGHVLYLGDLEKQTNRLLENIEALLKEGEASMDDIRYFIIYLRDVSDYSATEAYMRNRYPTVPHVIVGAKVCRPEWLIEMECIAEK